VDWSQASKRSQGTVEWNAYGFEGVYKATANSNDWVNEWTATILNRENSASIEPGEQNVKSVGVGK